MPPNAPPTSPPKAGPSKPSPVAQPAMKAAPKLEMAVARFDPPRIILAAVEGWGKSSWAAHAPHAAILMARGETGYLTLLGKGLVPAIPAVTINTWSETLAIIDGLIEDPQGIKFLGLDAMSGFERMCHEHVCQRDFGGDMGERGFSSFQKGYDLAVTDWLQMLARLDTLRLKHGVAPIFLSHIQVRPFRNPEGSDYDRYVSDVHAKTWAVTHKWADVAMFGKFYSVIVDDNKGKGKGKGIGGDQRVVYTRRRDAWDAKNRYGMPEAIDLPDSQPDDYTKAFSEVWGHIIGGNNA